MDKHKFIGILAGMGPKSTAPFIDLVVNECQRQYGAKYDEDFPRILIYSLPTPFYLDKPINHDKMEKVLCAGLKKLESCGVDFIATPSNSPHVYFGELKKCISIPLLNIIEVTVKSLERESRRVALLATKTTCESGLYQTELEMEGYEIVEKKEWQFEVNELIKSIKAGAEETKLLMEWKKIVGSLKREHVDTVIIACTDLNAIRNKRSTGLKIVDSSECLAKAVISKYLE